MEFGAVTAEIDFAQIALYTFWLFFAGLIYYLRTEDKREGYPLITEKPGERVQGFPPVPKPKTFLLQNGSKVLAPNPADKPEPSFDAAPVYGFAGTPMQPLGNPMLAGTGPAAYALRADVPDLLQETGEHRVVPLRVATEHFLAPEGPNPVTMPVVGADGIEAGVVFDAWIDIAEAMVRYLEVTLVGGGTVLVPMPLSQIDAETGIVTVVSVMAAQFADAPRLASPDQVTLREEDRIQAYFGGGHMYAEPSRMEPLI
jgi:photosynthetic reaction center H subunit